MSAKHEEIDLNVDAISRDRENEGDAPVIGDSFAETLMKPCTAQGEVQGSDVEKVRVLDSGKLISELNAGGNDFNLNSEGVDREADILGKIGNEVEKGSDYLDREVDAKTEVSYGKCVYDVSMHDENKGNKQLDTGVDSKNEEENGNCGEDVSEDDENEVEKECELLDKEVDAETEENDQKCGKNVSMHDVNEVQRAPVAGRASSEAEMHRDMNLGPVGEEMEQGALGSERVNSLHRKFEEPSSDELENKAIEIDVESEPDLLGQEINYGVKFQSSYQKFEEATSDWFENEAMEVDAQTKLVCIEDQLMGAPVSELQDPLNVLSEPHAVNLVVDLHPYMAKDGNASNEVNAKLVTSGSEFREGDLVWGKVRSHPWWPGQIFNHSAASQKAKKYLKKDGYLIAYFGDQTFAWNDVSKIKPFHEHFAFMERQTSLEDFHYAVDCTLEEVARRVEFGLACSCIPEEAFAKIKTQIIVNAGIREEYSTRDGGDSFSNTASFLPVKISEHIKALAQLPSNIEVDKLEFVTVKAQLSAFYRWKGYLQLPEFNMLGGLLESDAEIPLSGVNPEAGLTQSSAPDCYGDKKASSEGGKLRSEGWSSHKRKQSSVDNIHPSKKEKCLLDLLFETRANMSNGKRGTDGKGDGFISLSSGRKRKPVDSISYDRVVKHKEFDSISDIISVKSKKLDSISFDMSVKDKKSDVSIVKHEKADFSVSAANKCLPVRKTFGIGNSILKVASQLNGSSPIFKSVDGTSQKPVVMSKSKEKSLFRKSQTKMQFPSEETSPAELLSKLCLAARDPMEEYNLLIPLAGFFLKFRNLVCLEQSQEEVSGDKAGNTRINSETTETSGLGPIEDTYWTDRIIQNTSQEQQELVNKNEAGEILLETPSQKDAYPVEPTSAVPSSSRVESPMKTVSVSFEQEAVKSADPMDGCCSEDLTPTALLLNFTDLDSVPSKENLNEIFSRFGPLIGLGTEVKKSKRARVVFKRRADAETAFSSAGKYSIFGPSLVSYCLKYMPSASSKSSSGKTKKGRKAAIS